MHRILFPGKFTAREFLKKFLRVENESVCSLFKRPEIWQWRKHTVARSLLIGLSVALLPLPFQMIVAALASVYLGAYLPLAVLLVWISNPVTFLPLTWVCLSVGCNLLQIDMTILAEIRNGQYWQLMQTYWLALLIGSSVTGLSLGLIGYHLTHWCWGYISSPVSPGNSVISPPGEIIETRDTSLRNP